MVLAAEDLSTSISARYRALIRIAQAIRGHRDPKELFQLLTRELREVLPFDAIVQFDEAAQKVHFHHCQDHKHPHPNSVAIAPQETVAWWVYHNQQPVMVRDAERETRFPANMAMFKRFGILSACAVPLTTAHRRLGSLAIASESADSYSDEDVLFFSLVADQIALATDDALNFEASQRAGERLQLLLDLSNRVMANLELPELLKEISASIRHVMQCDGVGVILPATKENGYQLYALHFPKSKGMLADKLSMPVDEKASLSRVIRSLVPLAMNKHDLAADVEGSSLAIEEGIQAVCHVPLIGKNRTLGALSLGRLEDIPFTIDDVEFLTQVANQVAIAVENALAYRQIAELKDRLAQEKVYLESEIRSELKFEEIIGKSASLRSVLSQIETVAPTDSTVLIYGDTGTGKELVARALHDESARRDRPFVALNTAAIPSELLESELFGHEAGAFTGATRRHAGRFEQAEGGTLFLDEIGDMPLALQTRLLRVLAGGEFYRVGGRELIRCNVRIVAATHQDLDARVSAGQFRADLKHRLDVVRIALPTLRSRRSDIPLLARHFIQVAAKQLGLPPKRFSRAALKAIEQRDFPGNVRELENLCRRLAVIAPGSEILPADLADSTPPARNDWTDGLRDWVEQALAAGEHDIHGRAREALDRTLLEAALAAHDGHRQHAAAALGVGRNTLTRKLGASRTRRS